MRVGPFDNPRSVPHAPPVPPPPGRVRLICVAMLIGGFISGSFGEQYARLQHWRGQVEGLAAGVEAGMDEACLATCLDLRMTFAGREGAVCLCDETELEGKENAEERDTSEAGGSPVSEGLVAGDAPGPR